VQYIQRCKTDKTVTKKSPSFVNIKLNKRQTIQPTLKPSSFAVAFKQKNFQNAISNVSNLFSLSAGLNRNDVFRRKGKLVSITTCHAPKIYAYQHFCDHLCWWKQLYNPRRLWHNIITIY